MDWLRLGRAEGADGPYADLARGLDAATTAPAAPPRGTGRAHTRPDHADGTDGPVMALCGHTARRADLRRGLCRTCYRKLWEHDCLPPRGSRWDGYDALAAWARALPAETRARILAALAEAS